MDPQAKTHTVEVSVDSHTRVCALCSLRQRKWPVNRGLGKQRNTAQCVWGVGGCSSWGGEAVTDWHGLSGCHAETFEQDREDSFLEDRGLLPRTRTKAEH